jgi:hypothetical protein
MNGPKDKYPFPVLQAPLGFFDWDTKTSETLSHVRAKNGSDEFRRFPDSLKVSS